MRTRYSSGAVLFGLLVGCGGGGGGSGAGAGTTTTTPSTPAVATETVPLVLTSTNAGDAAQAAFASGEAALQLGELAVEYARLIRTRGSTSFTFNCESGGVAEVFLTDADQDRVPSAGDSVRARLRDGCWSNSVDDAVDGEFVFTLEAPATSMREAYRGNVVFNPGFAIPVSGTERIEVAGSLRIDWRRDAVQTRLDVASTTTNDLAFTLVSGSTRATERVRDVAATKSLRYDDARSTIRLSANIDSQTVRGRIQLRTPDDLVSFFDTFPDLGRVRVTGSGTASVDLVANPTDSTQVLLRLDSDGNGSTDRESLTPWTDVTDGYPWWEPVGTPNIRPSRYATRPYSRNDFRLVSITPKPNVPVRPEYVLQFSRPLSTPVPFAFRFVRVNSSPVEAVAADVDLQGARLAVVPRAQLRHGASYFVEKLSGEYRDQSGNPPLSTAFVNEPFTTLNNLLSVPAASVAVSMGGAQFTLNGSGSQSVGSTIRSYLWQQVAGPAATIATPAAAQTSVTPAVIATSGDVLTFRLAVTDAAGEVDTEQVEVLSFPVVASSGLFQYRSTSGDSVGLGRSALFTTAFGTVSVSRNFRNGINFSYANPGLPVNFWSASFSAAGDAPLAVGAYENARSYPIQAPNEDGINVSGEGRGCNGQFGRFDVREIAYDAGGDVTRLAIDFQQSCVLNGPAMFGSIRYRSDLPLRP